MNMSEKIRDLRKNLDWSQVDLAKKLGVHTTHVSRLETGKYSPSIDLLKKLAEIFGVTTDYLLYENIQRGDIENLKNKTIAEKIKMLDLLNEEDSNIIIGVIEAFVKKQKMTDFIENKGE